MSPISIGAPGATARTKAERLEEDLDAMLALPGTCPSSHDASRLARANSLSLVRFDRNDYSVPTAYAHHEVIVMGGVEEIAISCRRRARRHPPPPLGQRAHHL